MTFRGTPRRHAGQQQRKASSVTAEVKQQDKSLFGNSVAFDQMSAAGWKFVGIGPEVGDQGDLAVVGEIEEAQAGLGAFWPGELGPAGCVLAFADDPLHGEVPVVGEAFHVEPDVRVPAADLLPALGAAVDHVFGKQRAERIPVPGLGRGPVGCDHFICVGDGRQATGTFVGVLAQLAAAEPERGVADADDVLFRQHLARDPLAVDVCPAVTAQVDNLEAAVRVAAQLRVMPGDIEVPQRDVIARMPPDPDRLGRQGMRVRHRAILRTLRTKLSKEGADHGQELGRLLDHGPVAAAGKHVQSGVREQVDELAG
jgi:hypothetical protein